VSDIAHLGPPVRALPRLRALRPAGASAPLAQERPGPLHGARLRGQAARRRQRPRGRRARQPRDAHGANGRLHHLAFWVDTREECLRAADIWLDAGIEIEAAPSKHAIAQGFFLYGIEPGGNRVEVTTGGRFVYAPDEPCVVWTEAERAKGQAWGVKTVESFHTYGTPPVGRPRS
jgi:Glyoxalase/Bleomycin resistance protein/Dioxygenase superfamily